MTKLKTNSASDFTRAIEQQIMPLLRQQQGFCAGITCVNSDRSEAISTSFWNTRADADAYHRTGYPEVMKILTPLMEGVPQIETFEVAISTLPELNTSDQERHEHIARLAYTLHLERGPHSDAVQNWLDAESTISRPARHAASH
jgi:hypothetical protein